jgi:hypothetical protein
VPAEQAIVRQQQSLHQEVLVVELRVLAALHTQEV